MAKKMPEIRKFAEFIANKMGIDVNLYRYSGRGMYGDQCPAFDVGRFEFTKALRYAEEKGLNPSYDNMGLDMVIYFPNVRLKKK